MIIITGTSRSMMKLDVARSLGAHHTIVSDTENVAERVHQITGGRGVDVIIDVVPIATKPILDAIEVAKTGATIILAAIKGKTALSMNVDRVLYKELTLKGVYSQGNEAYREAFRIIEENPPELAAMHTHEFKLEDAETALLTLGREINSPRDSICMTLHPSTTTMTM
jgi:threonine dehydrogenase-like Zn-dependent dehydrogenase